MAVAMPVLQIAHTELWRAPSDAASMQATISDMHKEIDVLRQAQREVAERIEAALDRSDRQAAEVLRDIGRSLAEQRSATPVSKLPTE